MMRANFGQGHQGLPSRSCNAAKAGGAKRDRTADLLHAMQALSQLSYGPIPRARFEKVVKPAFRERPCVILVCPGGANPSEARRNLLDDPDWRKCLNDTFLPGRRILFAGQKVFQIKGLRRC